MSSFDAFVTAYRRAINAQADEIAHGLRRGKPKTYDAYVQMTGRIDGLEQALSLFQECLRNYAEIEDDD